MCLEELLCTFKILHAHTRSRENVGAQIFVYQMVGAQKHASVLHAHAQFCERNDHLSSVQVLQAFHSGKVAKGMKISILPWQKRQWITVIITCRAKLLKCDWLMRRAFFLNSGQKLLDPDWLRCFILSIRTKYQKYTQ